MTIDQNTTSNCKAKINIKDIEFGEPVQDSITLFLREKGLIEDGYNSLIVSKPEKGMTFNINEIINEYAEIYAAEKALGGGWISVDERLPEFNEAVLCRYRPRQPVMEGALYGIFRRLDNPLIRGRDENKFHVSGVVTHWMSLPKPPKTDN